MRRAVVSITSQCRAHRAARVINNIQDRHQDTILKNDFGMTMEKSYIRSRTSAH